MKRSSVARRLTAAYCLAGLLLVSGPSLAAVGGMGSDCDSMATRAPMSRADSHDCGPRARVVACPDAPCCALAPSSRDEGRRLLQPEPAPVGNAPDAVAQEDAFEVPTLVGASSSARPTVGASGRERLKLFAILLI